MFRHVKLPEIKRPFVERLDRSDGHYYRTVDGKIYPSITTVLGVESREGIEIWRSKIGAKEADRIQKESMEAGTMMHKLCEYYLGNKELPEYNEMKYAKSPMELFEVLKPELDKLDNIHALEAQLYSDELELAGTVDCIAEYEGKLSIIDFKNSRKPKTPSRVRNYFKQGAAYSQMWKECRNMEIDQIVIMVASWDNKGRSFKANIKDWISPLWDTLIKFEREKI